MPEDKNGQKNSKSKRPKPKPIYEPIRMHQDTIGMVRVQTGGGYRVVRKPKVKDTD